MVASLTRSATHFQPLGGHTAAFTVGRSLEGASWRPMGWKVFAGGGDYLRLLHPSRNFGAFGVENSTTRAHGNRAGLFFPTKSLLDLLRACSARRNASTARIALSGLMRPSC